MMLLLDSNLDGSVISKEQGYLCPVKAMSD
jgi:hypothetical protein